MKTVMRLSFRFILLCMLCLPVWASAQTGIGSQLTEAMREFQARYRFSHNGNDYDWPALFDCRISGIPAPANPASNFYGSEVEDPRRATELVTAFMDAVRTAHIGSGYIKSHETIESLNGLRVPVGTIETMANGLTFWDYSDYINPNDINESNYYTELLNTLSNIRRMKIKFLGASIDNGFSGSFFNTSRISGAAGSCTVMAYQRDRFLAGEYTGQSFVSPIIAARIRGTTEGNDGYFIKATVGDGEISKISPNMDLNNPGKIHLFMSCIMNDQYPSLIPPPVKPTLESGDAYYYYDYGHVKKINDPADDIWEFRTNYHPLLGDLLAMVATLPDDTCAIGASRFYNYGFVIPEGTIARIAVPDLTPIVDESITCACACIGDANCPAGTTTASNSSVNYTIELGLGSNNQSAGYLNIHYPEPNDALKTSAALDVYLAGGATEVAGGAKPGTTSTITTPLVQLLINDDLDSDPNTFDWNIEFYHGTYTSGDTPYQTITFEAVYNGSDEFTAFNITESGDLGARKVAYNWSEQTFSGVQAQATATLTDGEVTGLQVTQAGEAYLSLPEITITGDGMTATATAIIEDGVITDISITNGGSGYTSAPAVQITQPEGSGASATPNLAFGSISAINVINGGMGYNCSGRRYDPIITDPQGTGVGAIADLPFDSTYGFEQITVVEILAGGSGYSTDTYTNIVINRASCGGAGAVLETVVNELGAVESLNLISGGSGYYRDVTVDIAGGGGFGAAYDAIVQNGVITDLVLRSPGFGYTSAPTVTINERVGTGASAHAVIANGQVVDIVVDDGGRDYSGTIEIALIGGGGSGATASAVAKDNILTGLEIITAGFDYTTAPTVTIAPPEARTFGTWEMVEYDADLTTVLRKESKTEGVAENGSHHETIVIKDASDKTLRHNITAFRDTGPFEAIDTIEEKIIDASGNETGSVITYHSYYEYPNESSYGLLHQVWQNNNGPWTEYEYDSSKRITKMRSQYLSNPLGSSDSQSRVTEYEYIFEDLDADTFDEAITITTEKVQDQVVSRTFEIWLSQERTGNLITGGTYPYSERLDITALDLNVDTVAEAFAGTNCLTTKTRIYSGGNQDGRTRSIANPDGTITIYEYSSDLLIEYTYTGVDDGTGDDITDGFRQTTVLNSAGSTLVDQTHTYPENELIDETIAVDTSIDAFGRIGEYAQVALQGFGMPPAPEVLHWTFDDISTGTVADETGQSREGIITSNMSDPSSASGQVGNAIQFDGNNAVHVRDEDAENYLNGLNALTVSIWVKSNETNTDRGIINGQSPNGQDQPLSIRYDREGAFNNNNTDEVIKIGLRIDTDPGAGQNLQTIQIESSENVQTTQWQHLTITWSSGDKLRLYINGIEDTGETHNDSLGVTGVLAAISDLYLGRGSKDSAQSWFGLIDDFRIYNRVITQQEIDSIIATQGILQQYATTSQSYGCCGVDSVTDAEGIATTYNYDGLKRITQIQRTGITTDFELDALGRTTKTTVNSIIEEERSYDSRGNATLNRSLFNDVLIDTTVAEDITGATYDTITTTYPDGSTRIETYYKDGSPYEVTGTAVNPVRYSYGQNALGQSFTEVTVLDTDQATATAEINTTFTDLAGRIAKVETPHPSGTGTVSTDYVYNTLGQLHTVTDPDNITTTYTYNLLGERTHTEVGPVGTGLITTSTTDYAYSAERGGMMRTTTSLVGTDASEERIIETNTNELESWVTQYGVTTYTSVAIDQAGYSRQETTTYPDNTQSIRQYNLEGRLILVETRDATGAALTSTTFAYNTRGRLQTSTDARNGPTQYTYYDDGQIHTITTPDPDSISSAAGDEPQTTTFVYTNTAADGITTTTTLPDGTTQKQVFTSLGQLEKAYGSRTYPVEYLYDSTGRLKEMTTWQGFDSNAGTGTSDSGKTTWNYNAAGLLLNKLDNASKGPTYTYTAAGRLDTRTWARGIVTDYDYTANGQLHTIDYYDDGTAETTYQYSRAGRVTNIADASGTRTLAYTAGQLADETYTAGALDTFVIDREYDSLNRLSQVNTVKSATQLSGTGYSYHPDTGRLATVTHGAHTATYTYVPDSNLVNTLVQNNGATDILTTTKTWDNLNRLTKIESIATQTMSHAYKYNAANQRTKATLENGMYWDYGYDALGQVTSGIKRFSDATPIPGYNFGYAFDDIGNRTQTNINGQEASYTPNLLNQYDERAIPSVFQVQGDTNDLPGSRIYLWNHDKTFKQKGETLQGQFYAELPADNTAAPLKEQVTVHSLVKGLGNDGGDVNGEETGELFLKKTPEIFVHDDDGNLIQDGRFSYTWNAENQLTEIDTLASAVAVGVEDLRITYLRDDLGRMMKREVYRDETLEDTEYYVWSFFTIIAKIDENKNLKQSYTWGLDVARTLDGTGGTGGLLAIQDMDHSETWYPSYDGHGNIITLIDSVTGDDVASFEYSPFGKRLKSTGVRAADCKFGYSSQFYDAETGMIQYPLRPYNPETGSFISRDPINEYGGLNLYGFTENNPANRWDFFGLVSNQQIFQNFADTMQVCKENDYPFVVDKLGAVLDEWIKGDSEVNQAFQSLQKAAKEIKEPFGKQGLSKQLKAAKFLGQIFGDENIIVGDGDAADIRLISNSIVRGIEAVEDEVKFGFDVLGKIGNFVDIAESATSSNRGALNAILAISSTVDKFGKAAGPFGKYYTDAIKGIDNALSNTGRQLVDDALARVSFICECQTEADFPSIRDDVNREIKALKQKLN